MEPHFYEEEPEDLYEAEEPPEEPEDPPEEPAGGSNPLPEEGGEGFSRASFRAAAAGRGGCRDCRSLSVDQNWREAFGVHLCHQCRAQYELISKGNAKEQYCLTDGDMKRLGSVSKANPQHKQWSAMKLFLLEQVEATAMSKHGTLEDLEEHRERQQLTKIRQRIAKRTAETQKVTQEDARLARIRQKIGAADERQSSSALLATDAVTEDGTLQRTYANGASVDVELI